MRPTPDPLSPAGELAAVLTRLDALGAVTEEYEQRRVVLEGLLEAERVRVRADAIATAWDAPPVWVHGDLAATNLLGDGGRLAGVIDFGQLGVGDPACDLVLAWTGLDASGRRVLRDDVDLDEDTWRRARGWALWKALVTLAGASSPDVGGVQAAALTEALGESRGGRV